MFPGVIAMNQIVIAPEVLEHFHELAKTTHRSETEVIDEALTSYLAADRHYLKVLMERIAAADQGEFASDEDVSSFFSEHGE
jgi:predicted transcriptional regulator